MAKKRESILKSLARLVGGLCFLLMAVMLLPEKPFWALVCLFAGMHVLYGEEPGPPQRRGTSRAKSSGTRSRPASARSKGARSQRQPPRSDSDDDWLDDDDYLSAPAINPATGLPMAGGRTYGVDVGGNMYGTTSADYGNDLFNDSFGSSDY